MTSALQEGVSQKVVCPMPSSKPAAGLSESCPSWRSAVPPDTNGGPAAFPVNIAPRLAMSDLHLDCEKRAMLQCPVAKRPSMSFVCLVTAPAGWRKEEER